MGWSSRVSRWLTRGVIAVALVAGTVFGYALGVTPGKGVAPAEPAGAAVEARNRGRHVPDAALLDEIAMLRHELATAQQDLWLARTENGALMAQIVEGYVTHKTVRIDAPYTAYPLMAPKLLLSVDDLPGGAVLAHFGLRSERFAVGERYDFIEGDCHCFLLLLSSVRDRAEFLFGCEPREGVQPEREARLSRPAAYPQP